MSVLATQNKGYGFWCGMYSEGPGMADRAWPLASTAIAESTGEDADSVRAFLDSNLGRHFADSVRDRLMLGDRLTDAIETVTERWMHRHLSRVRRAELCIPEGFEAPYLTLMVILAGIEDGVV